MIEILFSQSAYGSLKIAQRWGIGNCPSNSIVFVADRQTPPKEDIDVAWSMEDVSDSDIGDGRRAVSE